MKTKTIVVCFSILSVCVALTGTLQADLLEHLAFDAAGSDPVLGAAASIDTVNLKVGAGSLALSGAPSPDTSGNDGAVTATSYDWSASDIRTVAFWMKAVSGDKGDSNATMISLGSGTGGGNRFDIRLNGDALRLEVQSGGTTTTSNIADGTWHHIAIVVPNASSTVADTAYYIDGSYVGNFSDSTALATGVGPLRVGDSYQDDGRDFKGNIDDVQLYDHALTAGEIEDLYLNLDLGAAWDPAPAIAETGVDPNVILTWQTGEDPNNPSNPNPKITEHKVYMSDPNRLDADTGQPDPNAYLVDTLAVGTTEYDPKADGTPDPTHAFDLNMDATYYWRIDEVLGGETMTQEDIAASKEPNEITGIPWRFETAKSSPIVGPVSPTAQLADVLDDPNFTVSATNPLTGDATGLDYAWYHGAVGDTGDPVGSNSFLLQLHNVQVADDGEYWCRVTVTSNSSTSDSTSGYLTIKRRIGWWKMDGNLTDSENSYDGTYVDPNTANPTPTPTYATGADGTVNGAFEFVNQGIEGGAKYILMPDPNDFNFYPQGYTANAWIKNTDDGYGAYVAKQDRTTPWKGFLLNHNGANAMNALRRDGGDTVATSQDVTVNDGQWHMVTGTYDRLTGLVKVYVDGEFNRQAGPYTGQIDTHAKPLIFGAEETTGTNSPYEGLLDDVQIWNYEVDPITIAYLYTDIMTNETICIDDEGLDYDYNGDCVVNLKDFAEFASAWLNCRIIPGCVPRP